MKKLPKAGLLSFSTHRSSLKKSFFGVVLYTTARDPLDLRLTFWTIDFGTQ